MQFEVPSAHREGHLREKAYQSLLCGIREEQGGTLCISKRTAIDLCYRTVTKQRERNMVNTLQHVTSSPRDVSEQIRGKKSLHIANRDAH